MKAAVCNEFGKPLVIEEVDLSPPGKGQVKVRFAATAVCHSDIHDIKGELGGKPPFLGGHESAGYVEEVGEGVTAYKTGDSVVVTLISNCGNCYYCNTGMPHLCMNKFRPNPEVLLRNKQGEPLRAMGGVGGFAEYGVVGESQIVHVPEDMPMASVSLMACGVITGFGAVVNRAQVRPKDSVVVIGIGGVGINAIQGAAISGAYPIIAVDLLDNKLEAALKFGATHTVQADQDDAIDVVRQLTSGRGANYVFIMVGSVPALRQGFSMAGSRGMTVIVGLPPVKDMLTISPMEFIASEKVMTGGFMGSTNLRVDIPYLVMLYQTGRLKLDELITNRYPLEKINEAIESVEKGEAIRNVIVFE